MRFIQLTDLHLSPEPLSPAVQALRWAVVQINHIQPDFVIVSGDLTTYGDAESARQFIAHIKDVQAPVYLNFGNTEHRNQGAIKTLLRSGFPVVKHANQDDVLFLFPDTARAEISASDRESMHAAWVQYPHRKGCAIITHYPLDALKEDSRAWLAQFMTQNQIPLLVAGHKHLHRTVQTEWGAEVITRGLDPDKASGDLPGISLFEQNADETWTETFLPWNFPVELTPCDIRRLASPVGWSIKGNPIDTVRESRDFGLSCLELRPADLDFSMACLQNELVTLRAEREIYLSWHLPSLSWREGLVGENLLVNHVRQALDVGVNHLTVHVPEASAQQMKDKAVWQQFEEAFDRLFRIPVAQGVHLGIENVHNTSGVRPEDPECKFATNIDDYTRWIDALCTRFSDIPNAQVGAHFDVGHARNNGELGNMQPLGDWYARIGWRILGYHIHQIRNDAATGKLTNHREMFTPFDQRISYAGFIHAWSTRLINRAPLFVEIRNPDERRRSTRRLQAFFRLASEIHTSLDLPGRP